ADELGARNSRREALRLPQSLTLPPARVLFSLGGQQEANLLHETLARLPINDQLVICRAVVVALSTVSVRKAADTCLAPLVNAAEHTEVGTKRLYILEQHLSAGSQPDSAAQALTRNIDRAIALEKG